MSYIVCDSRPAPGRRHATLRQPVRKRRPEIPSDASSGPDASTRPHDRHARRDGISGPLARLRRFRPAPNGPAGPFCVPQARPLLVPHYQNAGAACRGHSRPGMGPPQQAHARSSAALARGVNILTVRVAKPRRRTVHARRRNCLEKLCAPTCAGYSRPDRQDQRLVRRMHVRAAAQLTCFWGYEGGTGSEPAERASAGPMMALSGEAQVRRKRRSGDQGLFRRCDRSRQGNSTR
jgi:hypothetical protein